MLHDPLVQLLAVLLTGEVLAVVTAGLEDLVEPLVRCLHSVVRQLDQGLAIDPVVVLESQGVRNSRHCWRISKATRCNLYPKKQTKAFKGASTIFKYVKGASNVV